MKKITILFCMFFSICALSAQNVEVADFESGDDNSPSGPFYVWGEGTIDIVDNPSKDDVNDSEFVLEKATADSWAAIALWNENGELFSSEYDHFHTDIYIPEGSGDISQLTVTLKGSSSISGAADYASATQSVSETGKWIHLSFDLSDMTDFDYKQFGLQVDDNDFGVFYVDNLYWSSGTASLPKNVVKSKVSASDGVIYIDDVDANLVQIYSITGVKIYDSAADGLKTQFSVSSGLYIVLVDGDATKVLVK